MATSMAAMAALAAVEPAVPKAHKELVKTVQLEGQVLLKIMQHCSDPQHQHSSGALLGLDVGQQLEVTDCFAMPASLAEDQMEAADSLVEDYQTAMLRALREVNVDNNLVGWYQSASMGIYQTVEMVETFNSYLDSIKKCVCIIYDPQRSARGSVSVCAVRLKESFIELFREQKCTVKGFRDANLSWRDIFVDLPIKIRNSNLVQAVIADMLPPPAATQADVDRLSLSFAPFLERNIQSLMECVDDIVAEQHKVTSYHKAVARQQQGYASWLAKRRTDNQALVQEGKDPLPEEDPAQFKPIPEPSILDHYLVTGQMSSFCDQINLASSEAIQKLFLMEGMQKAQI